MSEKSQWDDIGPLIGKVMLLATPIGLIFAMGITWSQLSERQDRLRRDVIVNETKIDERVKFGTVQLEEIRDRVKGLEVRQREAGQDFGRRLKNLERKMFNGAKP